MRLGSMLSHMYAPVVAQRLRTPFFSILVVAVALPLFAGSVQQVSMRAQDWRVWGWGGFKQVYSLSSQATGLYFTFPEGNTSAVNYMYQPRKAPIAGSALSLTYQIVSTGTPTWNYFFPQFDPGNLCVTPATTRFWFAQKGFNSNPYPPTYQWWSVPVAAQLTNNSTVTLTVPLTPDQWMSTYGKFGNLDASTFTDWSNSLQNPEQMGLSFGGGCYLGHGVSTLNGSAKFILWDYSIVP